LLLRRPEADGQHRQQVIEAAEWMADASDQAVVAVPGVGEGDGRGQQQGQVPKMRLSVMDKLPC
jgi:hypothetical protein